MHKYRVLIPNYDVAPSTRKRVDYKMIKFGAAGYKDYTMYGTPVGDSHRENYIKRHANEDWTNHNTRGFWSRWLLWNKPTISESIRDIKKRFGIKVIY